MNSAKPDPKPAGKVRGLDSAPLRMDGERVRRILPELIDAITDALVVLDGDRQVVAANLKYLETFGATLDNIVGQNCHDALNCPERAGSDGGEPCAACQVFTTLKPHRMLRAAPDSSGTPRRWEVSFNPILHPDGKLAYVVEVWRDISDRRQLEIQLSHGERLASLGLLAAGVAHEINNPMASVLTGIESLGRWLDRRTFGPNEQAEAREVLEVLEREARRCRETTDKLMLLGQPFGASPGWMDFNRAVRDTISLLHFELRKRGIQVVEQLDPELPTLWARESAMRGVCMNLAINAVQAMSAGGHLSVSTRREGERILLTIQDDGPGIAPEHLERIWDPFFTTKPVGQGTGLGLSITQRIVTRHGGSIRVESVLGQGARFIVELPIAGSGGSDV